MTGVRAGSTIDNAYRASEYLALGEAAEKRAGVSPKHKLDPHGFQYGVPKMTRPSSFHRQSSL